MTTARLQALGIHLPAPFKYPGAMAGTVLSGNQLFVSGTVPVTDGEIQFKGKLGEELSVEEGYQAARLCVLNSLALINQTLGSLDRVRRIVKLTVFVNSNSSFAQQPAVANGASDLLLELFGQDGVHARTAVGVAALPLQVPVEVEMVVEVAD